jgi:hypothetical protein
MMMIRNNVNMNRRCKKTVVIVVVQFYIQSKQSR